MADENKKAAPKVADSTKEIKALQEQNANLIERVETLETQLEALEEVANAAPTSSVSVAPKVEVKKPEIPKPTKVGGKQVTFKVPAFRLGGEKVLAEDAVKDKAMMEKIVKDFPGLVTVE